MDDEDLDWHWFGGKDKKLLTADTHVLGTQTIRAAHGYVTSQFGPNPQGMLCRTISNFNFGQSVRFPVLQMVESLYKYKHRETRPRQLPHTSLLPRPYSCQQFCAGRELVTSPPIAPDTSEAHRLSGTSATSSLLITQVCLLPFLLRTRFHSYSNSNNSNSAFHTQG